MDKNNENVPKIRFPGFTGEWEQRKLGEITDRIVRKNTDNESTLPLTISAQYGLVDQISFFNKRIASRDVSNYYLIKKGEFAYNKSYSDGYPYGAIKRLERYDMGVLSTLYIVFRIKEYIINSDYLVSYYDSNNWHNEVANRAAEGARNHGLLNISADDFFSTELKFPKELEEQRKIGEYFIKIENLITLHQRKLEHLQDKKKGLLQKMFPKEGEKFPELRFPGFTEPWEQRKLGEVIDYIVDNRGKNPKYYCESGIPVIDNYMIKNTLYPDLTYANRFVDENIYENFIRKYNKVDDILITLVGNGIGNITLFPADKAVIIQNTLGLRTSENKRFIFFLLMSKNREIIALDRGMAQPSIRQDEVLDIEIQIPNLKEQDMIGAYFSNLDNLITLHQRKLEHLQQQKKGLLQQMFI